MHKFKRYLVGGLMAASLAFVFVPGNVFAEETQTQPQTSQEGEPGNTDLRTGNSGEENEQSGTGESQADPTPTPEPAPTPAPAPAIVTGWVKNGNAWYYNDATGTAVKGWQAIDGQWYYFDLQTGVKTTNRWVGDYYVTVSGAMAVNQWIGDYYVLSDGRYARNQWIGNYYVGADGRWIPGTWVSDSRGWWYRDPGGYYPANTWRKINGTWYWFDGSGYMATGWRLINGAWYFMNGSGAMTTGWQYIGGKWYYMSASGAMVTGWQKIGNTWYYLNASGDMAYNEWRDGYWLNASGSWTYPYRGSWHQNGVGWWYGDTSGWYAANSVQWIDGVAYTFDAAGYWGSNAPAWVQGYSSPTSYLITVDTGACRVNIYQGARGSWSRLYDFACTPGKPSTATPKGTFSINGRKPSFGEGYIVYDATRFLPHVYFHSILYNPGGTSVQDGRLGVQASHGCVRLAYENAAWIYNNVGDGTTVVVY